MRGLREALGCDQTVAAERNWHLARNSANKADCGDDFLCSGRGPLLRSSRSQAMAVTRFFEGIDYGSGVILRIRVSTFIE